MVARRTTTERRSKLHSNEGKQDRNAVNVVSCYEFSWFIPRKFSFQIHKCTREIKKMNFLPTKKNVSHFVFRFLCDEKVDICQAFVKVWRDLFFHELIRRRQRWINQTKFQMQSKRFGEIVTFAVMELKRPGTVKQCLKCDFCVSRQHSSIG